MKVLHVIPSLGPARGGPSVALPTMARSLADLGVDVHIAATDDNSPGAHLDVPLGVPMLEHGVTTRYFPRQMVPYTFSWPLAHWLWRHVREYDLLHIHALFSFAAVPAALAASRRNVPYIVRPLGTLNRWGMENRRRLLKQVSFRLIESRIVNGAAVIHYTSEQERQEAAALGVRAPAAVIPLGLDLSEFAALPPPEEFRRAHPELAGKTMLLFLSRIDEKKGLDLLLPALAELIHDHPDVMLVVAGTGEKAFMDRLHEMARTMGVERSVLWTGFLGGRDKLAAFSSTDVFVLPSYSENFGVAPVEAMACGTPVVVSDQVAVSTEIAAAEAGLVVPCDVPALVDALAQMFSNAALRTRLGTQGKRLARERFSDVAMAHSMLALYQELCGRSPIESSRENP